MNKFSAATGKWITARVRLEAPQEEVERLTPGATPGAPATFGLQDALHAAHLLDDLNIAEVPVESMVRRYLIALAARVTGLDRREGWHARRDKALAAGRFSPESINDYFLPLADRFLLSGTDRPFLQDPRLGSECTKPGLAARLDMTRPSGSNAWWDKRDPAVDTPVPAPQATAWLAAWHGYAPAGLGARRTHGGHTSGSSKAAPYRGFVSYFPAVTGSLYASLICAIPAPEHWPDGDPADDRAPWEGGLPDPMKPAAPTGLVSLLTARTSRALLLETNSGGDATHVYATWQCVDDLPEATDPYLMERSDKGPVRAQFGKAAWREMASLVRPEAPRGNLTAYRPTALSTAAHLPAEWRDRVGLRVLAWEQERQERDKVWWAEDVPELMRHCEEADPAAADRATRLTTGAMAASSELGRALATAWDQTYPMRRTEERRELLGPATAFYYNEAGAEIERLLADPERSAAWRHLARRAYDIYTAPFSNPRHLAAAARARRHLTKERTDMPDTKPEEHAPGKEDMQPPAWLAEQADFMAEVVKLCHRNPAARHDLIKGSQALRNENALPWAMMPYLQGKLPRYAASRDIYLRVAGWYAEYSPNPRTQHGAEEPPAWRPGLGNLGWSLAKATKVDAGMRATRLEQALKAAPDADHLEFLGAVYPLVKLVCESRVAVSWPMLLSDLDYWKVEPNTIARRWMYAFYDPDHHTVPYINNNTTESE